MHATHIPATALLVFALLTGAAVAQQRPAYATFTGTIEDPASDMVYVTYDRSLADYAVRLESIDSVRTDADGRFSLRIPINALSVFAIKSGDRYIAYLKVVRPGDTVTVDFAVGESMSSLAFGGSAEIVNDFLFELEANVLTDSAMRARHEASFRLDRAGFESAIDERRALQLRMFEEYAAKHSVPADVREYITTEINYRWGYDRLQYLWKAMRLKGVVRGQLEVDSSYFEPMMFLVAAPLTENTGRSAVGFFREYITGAYETAFQESKNRGERVSDSLQYPMKVALASSMLRGEARDVATALLIREHEQTMQRSARDDNFRSVASGVRVTDSLVDAFERTATKRIYVDRLRVALARMRELAPGRPAPDFELRDLNGRETALSDLRGKTVFLEFWATTCAPCVAELPKTLELQKKLASDSIAFVYISLDESESKWRKFIDKRKFTGTHLIAPGANQSPAAIAYNVSGIPRYFLIDRDGTIVSSDAPRPSGGAEELIRSVAGR